jgi:hypothetical protein
LFTCVIGRLTSVPNCADFHGLRRKFYPQITQITQINCLDRAERLGAQMQLGVLHDPKRNLRNQRNLRITRCLRNPS